MPRTHRPDKEGMTRKSYLGDWIESALSSVGVTSERVSKWIGKPCNCELRRDKLNALHMWLSRVVKGKYQEDKETAQKHLDIIMQEDTQQEEAAQEEEVNLEKGDTKT